MKPTILILTDWYLPGFKAGGPIKSISGIVRELSNDFKFILITSDRDFGSITPYDLTPNEWIIDENGNELIYLSPDQINFKKISILFAEKNPDIVYLNSFFSFSFSFIPQLIFLFQQKESKVILAPRGMLGKGALHLKPLKKQLFIALYKFLLLDRKVSWHVTSVEEKEEVINIFGEVDVFLAANISGNLDNHIEIPTKNINELKIFYLSRISPKKNLKFALKVLENLSNKMQGEFKIDFDIYGPIEDSFYWNECRNIISSIQNTSIQVNYNGEVTPVEISKTIQPYHLFFLPTLNENFGHVIVEALCNGKPVLLSDQTPWRNLSEEGAGWELPLAEFNMFGHKIVSMLQLNNEEFIDKTKNALNYISRKNNLEQVVHQTRNMFLKKLK